MAISSLPLIKEVDLRDSRVTKSAPQTYSAFYQRATDSFSNID